MSFEVRLTRLMDLFNITNKELASACNVDPSLVSRWRTGQRFPSQKYNQIQQIANFFLSVNIDVQQRQSLQEILSIQKLHSPLLEHPINLLSSWLFENRHSLSNEQLNNELSQTNTRKLVAPINYDFNSATLEKARSGLPLTAQTKREFHVFHGNSGKRKAALVFLQKALSIDNATDIYIFSDELVQWWLEDQLFQVQWVSYLKQIVMKKHRIHLIHNVNRNKEEFASYMSLWLPMHLVGSINSYYYPVYVENPIKETYMVIKNLIALESRSTFLTPKENICLVFEDRDTVDMIESLFLGRLVNCKPLIQVYKEQDQVQLLQLYLQSVSAEYNVIAMHHHINSLFLPESVFEKHCAHWTYTKKRDYMQFISEWKKTQYHMLSKKSFIDVFPFETLQDISISTTYSHYDPILFVDNIITLTKEEIIIALQTMLNALKRFHNLHVYLFMKDSTQPELNINIEYRENHSAVFTTNFQTVTPYIGLFSNEGNLMQTFGYQLNKLLATIPSSFRNRNETIKQINQALHQLEH
jgi:transcriptional regulator with XRE-family HTH domain